MNPNKRAVTASERLVRATLIKKSLGVRVAAGYMRAYGFSLEAALYWLTGRTA